jgi:hypothetical protein
MSNYQAQLQMVVDALRARQRSGSGPHAGGWGALLEPEAPSSIVNTAEALRVFALAGVSADDDSLTRGLRYLREKVKLHPAANGSHPEARGPKARYAAFGLMGLTSYSRPIEDLEHARAIATSVQWLERHVLQERLDPEQSGRGWSEHPGRSEVSVLSTSIAARALDQVPADIPGVSGSRALASDARRRLRSLARGDQRQRWWPARTSCEESLGEEAAGAAVTALAVLALAGGGPLSQGYARGGIRWLLAHPERWQQQREPEENVPDANWVHASCPLCLGAVLAPCGGVDPEREELALAISYLDQLWSVREKEWRHGHPAAEVSTSADLHAASAIRAMRRAWRGFDPVEHVLKGRRAGKKPPLPGGDKPHDVRWVEGVLTVSSANGSALVTRPFSPRASAMRALLDALSAAWMRAGPRATLMERSLSAQEITRRTSIRDVYEYVRRLNVAVAQSSREQRGRSCVLVQRIEGEQGRGTDRYALLGRRLALN